MNDKEAFQKWCREILPIVQGAANGEEVEYQYCSIEWVPKTSLSFGMGFKYRLKPKPKYRPYTPQEAAVCLLGQTIKHHKEASTYQVIAVHKDMVRTLDDYYILFVNLCDYYVFKDTGLPCGVLIPESSNG